MKSELLFLKKKRNTFNKQSCKYRQEILQQENE